MKKYLLSGLVILLTFTMTMSVFAKEEPKANTIGFMPFTGTLEGPGIGFFYERNLKKDGSIALHIPLYLNFDTYSTYSSTDSVYYGSLQTNYLFSPGIKFYVLRKSILELAVGPSFYYAFGKQESVLESKNYLKDDEWHYENNLVDNYFHHFGVLGNGYLNLRLNNHFIMTINLGLGTNYLSIEKKEFYGAKPDQINKDYFDFYFQFGLGFAYRF